MLKAAIKHGVGNDHIRHRILPQETVAKWAKVLEGMKGELEEVLREEKEEKHVCSLANMLPHDMPVSD
jgi:ATP-dependent RNA helicase DDX27